MIVGGGRELASPYELYEMDDSKVNEDISRAMRRFLPAVFPGKFDEGREPEMEWVSDFEESCVTAWRTRANGLSLM